MKITVYSIGFTKTTAETFFERLKTAGVKKLIDVRLNNTSQLAGFAKANDLDFFLRELAGIEYEHRPDLAPTQEILDAFKKKKGLWSDYVRSFDKLMMERQIETTVSLNELDGACLLCSEATPERCHRRLVLEYLSGHVDGELGIVHL